MTENNLKFKRTHSDDVSNFSLSSTETWKPNGELKLVKHTADSDVFTLKSLHVSSKGNSEWLDVPIEIEDGSHSETVNYEEGSSEGLMTMGDTVQADFTSSEEDKDNTIWDEINPGDTLEEILESFDYDVSSVTQTVPEEAYIEDIIPEMDEAVIPYIDEDEIDIYTYPTLREGQMWFNTRNKYIYVIKYLASLNNSPESDSNEGGINDCVVIRNISSNKSYACSIHAFFENLGGSARFIRLKEIRVTEFYDHTDKMNRRIALDTIE